MLLDHVSDPPESGTFLDLGCGWGPIAIALADASPSATVLAADVNERALDLARQGPGLGRGPAWQIVTFASPELASAPRVLSRVCRQGPRYWCQ